MQYITLAREIFRTFLMILQKMFAFFAKVLEALLQVLTLVLSTSVVTDAKVNNAQFGSINSIASPFNKGVLIATGGYKTTRELAYKNFLIAGNTGSGKSVRYIIPISLELIRQGNVSLLINDSQFELHPKLSGAARDAGMAIKTINFSDSSKSAGFNFLSYVTSNQDINKLSDLLTRNTIGKNSSDPFWTLSTKRLLNCFIELTLHQEEPYRHMAQVLHLTKVYAATPEKIDILIARTGNRRLALDYQSCIAMPEKTLQNVVASTLACLEVFENEEVAKVTSHNSLNLKEIRKVPTLVFLQNSVADQKFFSVLQGLFFEIFYSQLLKRPVEDDELDLYIILEEASSLYVGILPVAMATTRKARVSNIICIQNFEQLSAMYPTDYKNIVANATTKIFLPGMSSVQTMKEIEDLSGKTTVTDDKGKEHVKSLVTLSELRQMPSDQVLILSENKPMVKAKTKPYFKSWKYSALAELTPAAFISEIPNTGVRYLHL